MNPEQVEEMVLPSKTYLVENGRIISMTDDYKAMVQAVEKALKTPRYSVEWLSPNYGHDIDDLIGKSVEYARMEIERMIVETFDSDDRVETVEVTEIEQLDKTTLVAYVNVQTIFGDIKTEMEVGANGSE